MNKMTGVILAGGENRRMEGSHKALLLFHGEILIQRQIRLMKKIVDEIIVVSNDPRPFLKILGNSVRMITDYYQGKGPISGIYSALSLARYPDVWVTACDMPFLSADAASLMQEYRKKNDADAAIPIVGGKPCLLQAVYHKKSSEAISDLISRGVSGEQDLLQAIDYVGMSEQVFERNQIDRRFVLSFDTPEEFQRLLQMENPKKHV